MSKLIRTDRKTLVVRRTTGGPPGPPGPPGIGSTIGVKDKGSTVSSTVQRINFAGRVVSVSGSGADVTVTVSGVITPQDYGAVGDGTTNDGAAFVAAIAALKAFALNTGGAGFYKGSPKLFIPAGHYYLGTTTLDINHTLTIEGEGSGRFGPGAFGCTRLRWAAGANGLRIQHPGTSGNTTVDGTAHDGAGGAVIRGLCLQGGYAGTEGDFHGLVVRSIVTCEDLYILNWQGEGVKGWAGTVNAVNYGGNVSISCFTSVRCESNRIGWDIRGSDSNVVTFINCEGYQNRQAGFVDENGSGPNVYIGSHCASNGDISGAMPTKCTFSSKWYAAKWGGTFTNAPSGTTADTADWFYISAGSADATHPAHTATPNTFRAGGDFVTLSSAGVTFYSPYSEGNGFSQFNLTTLLVNPAMVEAQFRGGRRIIPRTDGFTLQSYDDNVLNIDSGTSASYIFGRSLAAVARGYIAFISGASNRYNAVNAAGHDFKVNGVDACNISLAGLVIPEIAAASVAAPAANYQAVFIDTADHKLKRKDSGGTVTVLA